MKSRRLVVGAVALLTMAGTAGCTPSQINAWTSWHGKDPAAAEAFANTSAVQSQLRTHTTRTSAGASRGRSGVNWDRVAHCESGGQWSHGLVHNRHGSFGGGLMIMQSAWRKFGGGQFASTPGGASRAEQIIVAERIAARVGAARAWQCPV